MCTLLGFSSAYGQKPREHIPLKIQGCGTISQRAVCVGSVLRRGTEANVNAFDFSRVDNFC